MYAANWSVNYAARGVIYDRNMFIEEATEKNHDKNVS